MIMVLKIGLQPFGSQFWQKLKYRMIDDASNGHNQTYGSSEAIHTTSASASATLTRLFRKYLGKLRNINSIKGASRDMKKAYKQLAVCPDQLRYMVVAVWSPVSQRWLFAISWALPFGVAGSVLHVNRVHALLIVFCRRWLAIPVQHFFDDFRIVEPQFADESGYKWFARTADFLVGNLILPRTRLLQLCFQCSAVSRIGLAHTPSTLQSMLALSG